MSAHRFVLCIILIEPAFRKFCTYIKRGILSPFSMVNILLNQWNLVRRPFFWIENRVCAE